MPAMSALLLANLGGDIGREIARGEPTAFVKAVAVVIVFAVLYRLVVYWRSS